MNCQVGTFTFSAQQFAAGRISRSNGEFRPTGNTHKNFVDGWDFQQVRTDREPKVMPDRGWLSNV